MDRVDSLPEFLLQSGGAVAGAMALGGGGAWFLAVYLRACGRSDTDIREWVERGTGVGFVFGVAGLIFHAIGVR